MTQAEHYDETTASTKPNFVKENFRTWRKHHYAPYGGIKSNQVRITKDKLVFNEENKKRLGDYVSLKWSDKDKAIAVQRNDDGFDCFKIVNYSNRPAVATKKLIEEMKIIPNTYKAEWLEGESLLLVFVETKNEVSP